MHRPHARLVVVVAIALVPLLAADAAPDPAPAPAPFDELHTTFPATRRWFGLVADLEFQRPAGGLVPRFETLHSKLVIQEDAGGQSLDVRLPTSSRGWHTIGQHGAPDIWVRVREDGLADVPARIDGGVVWYPLALAGGDLIYKLTPTHVDEYLYLRTPPPALSRKITFELGPGVSELRAVGDQLEVLDRQQVARLRLSAPFARTIDGTRRRGTVRVVGTTIVLELDLHDLAGPILVDPDWSTTGTMTVGHWADAAWQPAPGRVMVVAGCALSGCPSSFAQSACGQVLADTELWNEGTGTWSAGPPLDEARFAFGAVALAGGDFLVAGGCTSPRCETTTESAERYKAATGTWAAAGNLSAPRGNPMMARLPGGGALVAGGCNPTGCTPASDRYDATTNLWHATRPLAMRRGMATATSLADGRVLVIGGCADTACASILGDAEVYDPVADTWSPAGQLTAPRAAHTATLLENGTVLVAGGCADAACLNTLPSVELWSDANGGTFAPGATMPGARHNHTATRLATGEVLIAGGASDATTSLPSAEVYVPSLAAWVTIRPMVMDRAYHVAVPLTSGKVLLGGGCNPVTCMPWAEIYDPAGLPAEIADAGVPPQVDAGVSPDAREFPLQPPHPPAYRSGAATCGNDTEQQLPCPLAGFPLQDGDFVPNDHPLVATADGAVSDPLTGLVWEVGGDQAATDLEHATARCAALAPAGTWRLPSVVELMAIVHYGRNNPSMDPLFTDAQSTNYWTTTPAASGAEQNWTVRFDYGEVIPMGIARANPSRCVRGAATDVPVAGHVRQAGALVAGAVTVRDLAGGLEWQRFDDGVRRSWRSALAYCSTLALGGKTGWHLPNVVELRGLIEYGGVTGGRAVIDDAFPDARGDLYWTSTPNDGALQLAWSVSFNLGVVDGVNTTGATYARCVRHLGKPSSGGCGCDAGRRPPAGVLVLAVLVLLGLRPRPGNAVRRS